MHIFLQLSKGIDWITHWFGKALFWLMPILVVIGALTAILTKVGAWTKVSIISNAWLDIQYYLYALIFLGLAAYNLQHDEHVRVDVFYERLSKRKQALINVFGNLFFLLPVAGILIWRTGITAIQGFGEASSNAGGLPVWPIKLFVPFAFALLFLQGISQLIKAGATLFGKPSATSTPKEVVA